MNPAKGAALSSAGKYHSTGHTNHDEMMKFRFVGTQLQPAAVHRTIHTQDKDRTIDLQTLFITFACHLPQMVP